MVKISITSEERGIVNELLAQSSIDTNAISIQESEGDVYLLISNSSARLELFDCVTDQLQFEGFDLNYELTYKGKLLESLVDKLNS